MRVHEIEHKNSTTEAGGRAEGGTRSGALEIFEPSVTMKREYVVVETPPTVLNPDEIAIPISPVI